MVSPKTMIILLLVCVSTEIPERRLLCSDSNCKYSIIDQGVYGLWRDYMNYRTEMLRSIWLYYGSGKSAVLCVLRGLAKFPPTTMSSKQSKIFLTFTRIYHNWSTKTINGKSMSKPGLHNLFHPSIRDGSTWSKLGARGEHGDVFLFSNLGALSFVDVWIKIFIACLFKGSQEQSFFLQTLLFSAFLLMVLKILTYTLASTWSLVSSE